MILPEAYEYFDRQRNKYQDDINSDSKKFKVVFPENDLELFKFQLNDLNDNIVFQGNTSIIGYYNYSISTWYWGWSMSFKNKSENYLSRKILNYALDIDIYTENEYQISNSIFKIELLNSKLYMQNPSVEIEKNIALAMYLTKSDYFWKLSIKENNITDGNKDIICDTYYLLRDITKI